MPVLGVSRAGGLAAAPAGELALVALDALRSTRTSACAFSGEAR